jgi:bacterioferritin-associated ferredoxin
LIVSLLKATFNIKMFVCCCLGITDRQIHAEIDAGACSVDAISTCTGAGSRCGSCRMEIAAMIGDRRAASAPGRTSAGLRREGGRLHLEVVDDEALDIAAE